VRPGGMEFGSRRVSLHPNLPLLASLFHLCESVRICGRDPLSSRRRPASSGISRAATAEHMLTPDEAAERRSMRSTDFTDGHR